MRICNSCHEKQPDDAFGIERKYGVIYPKRVCKKCRSTDAIQQAERRRNRTISSLLRWPVPGRFA